MIRSRLLRLAMVALAPAVALAFGPAIVLAQAPPATTAPATPAPSDTTTPAPAAPTPDKPDQTAPATAAPATPVPTPVPTPPPASAAAPPAADPFGEEITLPAKTVLIYTGKSNWDSAFESLTDAIRAITVLLDKQGIKPAGEPMIVYTPTYGDDFVFQAEVPVDQEPKDLPKNMSLGKSPEGRALKFVHRGSYDSMDDTYEAVTNHLDDKGLEPKNQFIEEYVTDPLNTVEDKLVINIYVPLK